MLPKYFNFITETMKKNVFQKSFLLGKNLKCKNYIMVVETY